MMPVICDFPEIIVTYEYHFLAEPMADGPRNEVTTQKHKAPSMTKEEWGVEQTQSSKT